jgi:hypothetical protein
MTSDNEDLEQQLRENLKLRRELASEVAKAKDGSGGIAYRLGWVLYWASVVFIGLWWIWCAFQAVAHNSNPYGLPYSETPWEFWLLYLGIIGIPALVLYVLGRAFRYVLSGK